MGHGPNLAVASDGTVYVAWLDYDVTQSAQQLAPIYLDNSTIGGLGGWGTDVTVGQIWTISNPIPWNNQRVATTLCLEVSPTNPLELYLVYGADSDGPQGAEVADVFFRKSTDSGTTWSTSVRLDPWFKDFSLARWIAVHPDGTIDVAWYCGWAVVWPPDIRWDVLVARSSDDGNTWPTLMTVGDTTFHTPTDASGQPWLGDHLTLVPYGSDTYVGFTSSVSDQYGDVYVDLIPGTDGMQNNGYVPNVNKFP